jgi:2'-5' RNA ligase/GNAT superfamily N-acetyltransferase
VTRRRVGVALVIDPPVADEIDGLRRALGAGDLARIPPHVTLVRPLNLPAAELPAALERVRAAASGIGGSLRLTLGPAASFAPANPVLHLEVGGDLGELRRLREAVSGTPLDRPGSWPYVPHVTLVEQFPSERTAGAVELLGSYAAVVDVGRVVLMEEQRLSSGPGAATRGDAASAGRTGSGRPGSRSRWVPLADAALERRAVVGRGGVEIALTRGRVVGPDLVEMAACAADDPGVAELVAGGVRVPAGGDPLAAEPAGWGGPSRSFPDPVVVTAVAGSVTVGGAVAWWSAGTPYAGVLVTPQARGQGIGRHLLARLEADLAAGGWRAPRLIGAGPGGFYEACSRWVVAGGG